MRTPVESWRGKGPFGHPKAGTFLFFQCSVLWTFSMGDATEQDIWAPGRLGAGASASEILGVGQSSNVYAITGTHYFHQSIFYFRQNHCHTEKSYLLRIGCIDSASTSV